MDKDGDGCESYGGSCKNGAPTEERDTYEMFAVDHVSALDACCTCGGGEASIPGHFGMAGCEDHQEFTDKNGKTCSDYAMNTWCMSGRVVDKVLVDSFAYGVAEGEKATDACCVCGGGSGLLDAADWADSLITMYELEICPPNLALMSSDAVDELKMEVHECLYTSAGLPQDRINIQTLVASDGTSAG